jgi:predicted RNase H-like nuclease (RuvC/YqgF family)
MRTRRLMLVLCSVVATGCSTTNDLTKDISEVKRQVAEIQGVQLSLGAFARDLDRRTDALTRQASEMRQHVEAARSAGSRDMDARQALLRLEEYTRTLERELREMRKVVDRVEIVTVRLPGVPPQDGLRVKPHAQ